MEGKLRGVSLPAEIATFPKLRQAAPRKQREIDGSFKECLAVVDRITQAEEVEALRSQVKDLVTELAAFKQWAVRKLKVKQAPVVLQENIAQEACKPADGKAYGAQAPSLIDLRVI